MVIGLREFNDKKKNNNMDKCFNLAKKWKCNVLCCKVIKSQIDLKLKARSEFPNVWGEYKNLSNPFIQGTTLPYDRE